VLLHLYQPTKPKSKELGKAKPNGGVMCVCVCVCVCCNVADYNVTSAIAIVLRATTLRLSSLWSSKVLYSTATSI
jgi:hypothetical protein